MENILEIKNKILSFLKTRGPSLPVQIAKQVEKSTIITSALLSELFAEKRIKISNLKVGGSPLYFLQGQESSLEKFYNYLPGKEKEAFLLLKQKKVLQDNKQLPPIRVALRRIKDFAFPLVLNQNNQQLIFWRYLTFPEEQAKQKILEIIKVNKQKPLQKTKLQKPIPSPTLQKPTKQEIIEIIKPKKRQKKSNQPKEKSDFAKKVLYFLEKEDIELIEEKEIKKKEFNIIIRIDTDLGKIKFFCIAKDKKKITENDLRLVLQKAQNQKMPALIIYSGELSKKAKEYLENYNNLIKAVKLE